MILDPAATRYAEALFEASGDVADAARNLTQLEEIAAALQGSKELRRVIAHPLVPPAAKERVLARLYGEGLSDAVRHFLTVVCEHGRATEVAMAAEALRRRVDAAQGRRRALVRSVAPLAEGQIDTLREALQTRLGGTVEIETETDGDLIGGVEIRVGDQVLDLSVARRLRDLRRYLIVGSQAPTADAGPS
jgi:F-type H+-transporting ATPase subunit delta